MTKGHYLGCYAADQIPKIEMLNWPFSMVINESTSKNIGTHWVSVFSPNKECIFYFDSLADYPNIIIKNFLEKFKYIRNNKKILQNPFSDACGQFCIYFIYKMSEKYSMKEIINLLQKSKYPDLYVKNFVNLLIIN